MKRETIEKLLKDLGVEEAKIKGTVDSVMDENGKDIEAEKSKLTSKEAELSTANKTIKDLQDTVKKYDGKDPEALQGEFDNFKKKYDDDINAEKEKNASIIKSYALKDALRAAGVSDPDYVIFKSGGVEKFSFNDENKVVGLDDTIKPIKEQSPHLFKVEEPEGEGGSSKVTVNSGKNHKEKGDNEPESLSGALAEFYK